MPQTSRVSDDRMDDVEHSSRMVGDHLEVMWLRGRTETRLYVAAGVLELFTLIDQWPDRVEAMKRSGCGSMTSGSVARTASATRRVLPEI